MTAIYTLANCTAPDPQQTATNNAEIIKFATTQQLFPFKVLQDTMALLSRHYQTDRLQHGLHGLYPKHKDYCDTIAILLRTLGFSIITSAMHAYPGLLSDPCKSILYSKNGYCLFGFFFFSNRMYLAEFVRHVFAMAGSILSAIDATTCPSQLDQTSVVQQ